ncbi:MAG TPA: putative motility protein [Halanaerobiales bacterium]|nr:putative motility protein [Halanaerobiales bacterium]
MDINSAIQNQIASVKSAINMSTLQTSMNQDGATVNKLIEGMEETSKAVQEASLPHRGNNIDIRA